MTNIVLVGMAGTGKSGLARLMARELNREFIDTDEIIEKLCGMKMVELAKTKNIVRLCSEELLLAQKLQQKDDCLIAYGGTVYNAEVLSMLCKNSYIILLTADAAVLQARVRRKGNSALLGKFDSLDSLREIVNQRNQLYRSWSDAEVRMDKEDISLITGRLCALLQDI